MQKHQNSVQSTVRAMRQGSNPKGRSRGRGSNSKKGSPIRTCLFDGAPGVRVRGNAHQLMDKYLALARDASSSGDRVLAENYFQHADHYYRVIGHMSTANSRLSSRQTLQQTTPDSPVQKTDETDATDDLEAGEDGDATPGSAECVGF